MGSEIDLDSLLRREDENVEWKKGVAREEDVVKTLSAFANQDSGLFQGGWVLCGIEEGRDEHGFPQPRCVGLEAGRFQKIRGTVLSWCRERVSPPLLPTVKDIPLDGDPSRRVLAFYQAASSHLHAFRKEDGSTRYWVRQDSNTIEARGELLRQLLQQKRLVPSILERPCGEATLDDIDLLAAEEFFAEASLPRPAMEYLKPGVRFEATAYPLVETLPVAPGETREVPTCLALLLFSREPTRFIPGAYAVFSAYESSTKTERFSVRSSATGPLPKIIRDLLEKLDLYTGISIDKSASATEIRQNRPRYSKKALQEAVVNAFAHRDYDSPEPVRITVFSDRIEVASPGGPLPGMDLERLRQGESVPRWRNPSLASFLLRMGLAQNEGQGLSTILKETQAVTGRDPEIRPGPDTFEVILPAYEPPASIRSVSGAEGLILVSIGSESIRPVVESSLAGLGLEDTEVLVDFVIPDYVSPDVQHWEVEATRIRDEIRRWVEEPRLERLHLFYRGPVVIAPLLGALIAPAKPLVVYYFEGGRYEPAYTLDRRFLRSKA